MTRVSDARNLEQLNKKRNCRQKNFCKKLINNILKTKMATVL